MSIPKQCAGQDEFRDDDRRPLKRHRRPSVVPEVVELHDLGVHQVRKGREEALKEGEEWWVVECPF